MVTGWNRGGKRCSNQSIPWARISRMRLMSPPASGITMKTTTE